MDGVSLTDCISCCFCSYFTSSYVLSWVARGQALYLLRQNAFSLAIFPFILHLLLLRSCFLRTETALSFHLIHLLSLCTQPSLACSRSLHTVYFYSLLFIISTVSLLITHVFFFSATYPSHFSVAIHFFWRIAIPRRIPLCVKNKHSIIQELSF